MHCNNQIRTICRVVHENKAPEISTVNLTVDIQQQLTYMRKYARKMPLEYVRHDFTQNDLSWMKKYHINVSINKNILSDDMIQLFEANNIKINIWTINNKDQLYNFTNKGIKIVTSDDALWKE